MGSLYLPKYPHLKGKHVTKSGKRYRQSKVWWAKYRAGGRVVTESTGTTNEREARRFLARRMGAAAEGRPIAPRVDKVRVRELAEHLVNDYKANKRPSLPRLEDSFRHILPFFGECRAVGVTPADVSAYIARRQEEGAANATINRELTALRRSFSLGVENEKLHRASKVTRLREDNVRQGFFEQDQLEAVLRHLPPSLHPLVRFGYITGWRKGEILDLRWSQVDFGAGTVRLEPGTTKNREGRTFIITPMLRTVLEQQKAHTERLQRDRGRIIPHVFHRNGKPIRSFVKAWCAACTKAGAPWRIFHDLRRTAVRNLERAGVPRSVAMKMVGHKTEAIYRRYAIVDEAMMREGADKLAAWQQGQVGKEQGKVALSDAEYTSQTVDSTREVDPSTPHCQAFSPSDHALMVSSS